MNRDELRNKIAGIVLAVQQGRVTPLDGTNELLTLFAQQREEVLDFVIEKIRPYLHGEDNDLLTLNTLKMIISELKKGLV